MSVYRNWVIAQDPSANPLAMGELILGSSLYTDDSRNEGGINEDPAAPKEPDNAGEPDCGINEKLNGRGATNAVIEPIPLVLSRGVSTEHKGLKQYRVAEGWRKAWRDRIKKSAEESSRSVKAGRVHADAIPRVQKMIDEGSNWVKVDEIHAPYRPSPKKWKWLW